MARRSRRLAVAAPLVLITGIGLPTLTTRAAGASAELTVEGAHFRDARGGTVVLRGVNVAGNAKVPPFRAVRSPAELDPLPGWGMNVIRLLFIWEAYEPELGAYDETYLDAVTATAAAAWAHGLYVVLDFHQDAFSRYSIGGCGDGFPKWALPPDVQPATPDNGPACSNWGLRMLSDMPMQACWTAFHRGDNGVRARFLGMVERVAHRLSAVPGVIGYDIMNEPWGDEATELAALHRDAGQAIRSADPSAILFLSPHAFISAGFSATQLPAPTFANAAYSPHFYDGSVLFGSWGGTPPDGPFRYMRGTAVAWGVPLFVGEIGGPATAENVGGYMDAIYDRLDETFASATQWVYTPAWTADAKDGWNAEDFSIVDGTGALRANFGVRPYAQRISGTPVSARATHEAALSDNVFELAWDHVPSAGTTDVFLPREVFFGTPNVIVETEGDAVDCAFQGTRLSCSSAVAGAKKVTVRSGGTDAGADEARPMSDAEARDAVVGPPVSASGGGCACRTASRSENAGALKRFALLGLGLATAITRKKRRISKVRADPRNAVSPPTCAS